MSSPEAFFFRWRLIYSTTLRTVCQAFFWISSKLFSKPFQSSCPPAIRSGPRKPHKYSTFYHFCCGAVIGQLCYITTSVSKCQHLFAKFLTTVRIVLYSRFGLIPRVIFLLIRRVSTPRAPALRRTHLNNVFSEVPRALLAAPLKKHYNKSSPHARQTGSSEKTKKM